MPLLSVPPWKTKTTEGTIVYSSEVKEGYFLEVLSLIASRLTDLNETMKEIADEVTYYNKYKIGKKS